MIKIENTEVVGFSHAIRGMRNPMNSWNNSDSFKCIANCNKDCDEGRNCFEVGENDLSLMKKLAKAGSDHRKFMRMIVVYADIVAPDYWFKEFSTYRVGVTENSTSTMHRIQSKEFTLDDFSHEHLMDGATDMLNDTIRELNYYRELFIQTKHKNYWWQMIQLLPMSYNYRRTVCMNYEVLANMYHARKNHKLDEWREFCKWVETLPYSEIITGGAE